MKNTLIIFIDGLQFQIAMNRMKIFSESKNKKVIPGIGFSNNIYPEIICGKTPDDIGYFNEWSPKETTGTKLPYGLRALDSFRDYIYLNAGIRKIILSKLLNINYSNIPFRYAHYFKPQGSHDFKDIDCGILREYEFEVFDSVYVNKGVGKRDCVTIERIKENMDDKNMFLSLIDLDNIAHVYGLDSDVYSSHLEYLDSQIEILAKQFMNLNEKNDVFLFSDHGMVEVNKVINFDIEDRFGPMNKSTYLYFIDTTYLRVWTYDDVLKNDIYNYLANECSFGSIIEKEERKEFGLTNKDFGDIIFRANEGVVFNPNFYGSRPPKAMHGYDSHLESQKTIFSHIYKDEDEKSENLPTRSSEIFTYLDKYIY